MRNSAAGYNFLHWFSGEIWGSNIWTHLHTHFFGTLDDMAHLYWFQWSNCIVVAELRAQREKRRLNCLFCSQMSCVNLSEPKSRSPTQANCHAMEIEGPLDSSRLEETVGYVATCQWGLDFIGYVCDFWIILCCTLAISMLRTMLLAQNSLAENCYEFSWWIIFEMSWKTKSLENLPREAMNSPKEMIIYDNHLVPQRQLCYWHRGYNFSSTLPLSLIPIVKRATLLVNQEVKHLSCIELEWRLQFYQCRIVVPGLLSKLVTCEGNFMKARNSYCGTGSTTTKTRVRRAT